MAPHSSTLAWNILWMEESGRLQSMGLLRVGHDWATFLSLFTFMHWRRQWQPTPVFLPGESQGAWWAAVYGVAQSRTRLIYKTKSFYIPKYYFYVIQMKSCSFQCELFPINCVHILKIVYFVWYKYHSASFLFLFFHFYLHEYFFVLSLLVCVGL